jgi:hypothetical protein
VIYPLVKVAFPPPDIEAVVKAGKIPVKVFVFNNVVKKLNFVFVDKFNVQPDISALENLFSGFHDLKPMLSGINSDIVVLFVIIAQHIHSLYSCLFF